MKWKKLLALALAGVLALALLTGCSGTKSEDRLIAENVAGYIKGLYPNLEVSYDVSGLESAIKPAFSADWFARNEVGNISFLDRNALTANGQTADAFLKDSLKKYAQCSSVNFIAFDATGKSASEQAAQFAQGAPSLSVYYRNVSPAANTKLRVGVCHKAIDGRNYCLMVLVFA